MRDLGESPLTFSSSFRTRFAMALASPRGGPALRATALRWAFRGGSSRAFLLSLHAAFLHIFQILLLRMPFLFGWILFLLGVFGTLGR